MDNPFQSPVVLSICTGMRGLERGLERAIGGFTVAAYVEIEAFIIYNLVRQMEQGVVDAAPVWTDIKTFPAKRFHRKIHWIVGGYPCQPFSVAGKQKGTEDPRHLWPYIRQTIRYVQPFGCFFENVPNHLNIGYREVKQDLEEMGYAVTEGIYSAEEVGAPQQRKRLFILAMANSCDIKRCISKWQQGQERGKQIKNFEVGRPGKAMAFSESKRELSRGQQYEIDNRSRQQLGGSEPGSHAINVSENMANPNYQGLEGRNGGELQKCTRELFIREGSTQPWPAGQGEYQHEWEEPRTVESGMGCTVNGYNFRTDLLRMYGNGVVEQTAQLAFIDLMNKYFN